LAHTYWAAANDQPLHYNEETDQAIYGGVEFQSLAEKANPAWIYIKDLSSEKETVLWQGKENICDVSPSPDFKLVACRERNQDSDTWVMHIIDLDGKELVDIENVYRLSWSPESDKVAYIIGEASEGGMGFLSRGISIYDINTKKKSYFPIEGYDLNWADFDASIYILALDDNGESGDEVEKVSGEKVIRLDPSSGGSFLTPHRGIYFSPDGTLYYRPGYHGTEFGVFNVYKDIPIDLGIDSRGGDGDKIRYAQPTGWLDNGTLVLPSGKPGEDNDYVVDVTESGSTRSVGESRIRVRPRGAVGKIVFQNGQVRRGSD